MTFGQEMDQVYSFKSLSLHGDPGQSLQWALASTYQLQKIHYANIDRRWFVLFPKTSSIRQRLWSVVHTL